MTQTLENNSFSVETQEESGCRLSLKIFVKPEETQKAYKKAIKVVNKQISIPGFRKGKAPDATVISRYSSYIEQEWKEILVNEAYRGAVELVNIYPMTKESIQKPKIESCSQEEGAVVKITYEHYPHVPRVNFSDISIPKIAKEEVTEERIQEVIEEIKRSQAGWEEITDREVRVGDFVDISIDSLDEETPKTIVKDRRFEVEDKRMAPWLRKLLEGMKIGETSEGVSEVDEKADKETKKKFKPTKVRITLNAIKKIILPELDDALAKKVGANSKDDLLQKIERNLEKEMEETQRAKMLEALDQALLDQYPFELPFSIVESERRERIRAKIQSLKDENFSDEEIQMRQREIEQEIIPEVDRRLRLYFLNKQIAKQGNISLTNQELNDEIVRQISSNPYYYGKEMNSEASKELVSRMAATLMQKKTESYALSQVLTAKE